MLNNQIHLLFSGLLLDMLIFRSYESATIVTDTRISREKVNQTKLIVILHKLQEDNYTS